MTSAMLRRSINCPIIIIIIIINDANKLEWIKDNKR